MKMIVDSMSYEDVAKFLIDDFSKTYPRVMSKRMHLQNKIVRKCKAAFSGTYPYDYSMFDIKSENNITYDIRGAVLSSLNRKYGGGPYAVTKVSYRGISHYVMLFFNFSEDVSDSDRIVKVDIFHPHVMQRYFERIHDEYAENNMENFLDFLTETGGITKFLTVPVMTMEHPRHGDTDYMIVNNGILIGNKAADGKSVVYKTFVSEDMFKDSQSELHSVLNDISDFAVTAYNEMYSDPNSVRSADAIFKKVADKLNERLK